MIGKKRKNKLSLSNNELPPSKKQKINYTEDILWNKTVADLRIISRKFGLSTKGRKHILIDNILQLNNDNNDLSSSSSIEIDLSSSESFEILLSDDDDDDTNNNDNNNFISIDILSEFDMIKNSLSNNHSCKHVTKKVSSITKLQSILLNPINWKCNECQSTESVWGCLSCGYIGCGIEVSGHIQLHYNSTKHCIIIDINNINPFCYLCESTFINDTNDHSILEFKQYLKALSEQNFTDYSNISNDSSSDTLERKLKRKVSQFIMQPEDLDLIDCYSTSLKHYRNNYLIRSFRQWQRFINYKRLQSLSSSLHDYTSSDSEDEFPIPNIIQNHQKSKQQLISPKLKRTETLSVENLIKNSPMTPKLPVLIPSSPSVLLTPGQTGLRNLGNSCFMNAILQAMSSISMMRRYFIQELLPTGKRIELGNRIITRSDTIECFNSIHDKQLMDNLKEEEISLCLELHKLWRVMWSGKNAVISPYSLFFALWKLVPTFSNYKQQDAEELLCFLLSRIESELRKSFSKYNHKTIIQDTYEGTTISNIYCSKCKYSSQNEESFYDLSLNIPLEYTTLGRPSRRNKNVAICSLDDLFKHFICKEELSGYKCNSCLNESCTRQFLINKLPNILCIVIKRFYWSDKGKRKINTQIRYPLILDISKYSTKKNIRKYKLKSIVLHHGHSLHAGHYTANVYNDLKESWYDCNDIKIKEIIEDKVLTKNDSSPYILFYEII